MSIIGINTGHYPDLMTPHVNRSIFGNFPIVRFMQWQQTNHTDATPRPPLNYDDLPQETIYNNGPWRDFHGVSLRDIVAMANSAAVRPWVCIPHMFIFDKLSINQFVNDVIEHSNKRPIFEYSNEVWNMAFKQFQDLGGNIDEVMRHVIESTGWIKAAVGDRADVVVSFQARNISVAQRFMPQLEQLVDAIAIAPYFGQDGKKDATSLQQAVDVAISDVWQYRTLADQYGLKLFAYECGSHIADGQFNKNWLTAMFYHQLVVRMNGIVDMIMLFSAVSRYNQYGGYGLFETVDNGRNAKPTHKWELLNPLLTRPKEQRIFEQLSDVISDIADGSIDRDHIGWGDEGQW